MMEDLHRMIQQSQQYDIAMFFPSIAVVLCFIQMLACRSALGKT